VAQVDVSVRQMDVSVRQMDVSVRQMDVSVAQGANDGNAVGPRYIDNTRAYDQSEGS
jgi:hypothetical protein